MIQLAIVAYTVVLCSLGIFVGRQAFDPMDRAKFDLKHWAKQSETWKEQVDSWKAAYNENAHLLPEPQPCPSCDDCVAPDYCEGNHCPEEVPDCPDQPKRNHMPYQKTFFSSLFAKRAAARPVGCAACPSCHGNLQVGDAADADLDFLDKGRYVTCQKSYLMGNLTSRMNSLISDPPAQVAEGTISMDTRHYDYASMQQCLQVTMPLAYDYYQESIYIKKECLTMKCLTNSKLVPYALPDPTGLIANMEVLGFKP